MGVEFGQSAALEAAAISLTARARLINGNQEIKRQPKAEEHQQQHSTTI